MRIAPAALLVALLGFLPVAPALAQESPPRQELTAFTVLPPGNSGFFSVEGQLRGEASGKPSEFGEHIDDQRELYWGFGYKPGKFHAQGEPVEPKPGVRIYRDGFGVPAVYADTGRDVWFGAGYSAAVDRLFFMDGLRRTGLGTLAELAGSGSVPADIKTRVLTYSAEEYEQFFVALPQAGKDAVDGYVDGVNARLDEVAANPRLLPAEYVLLTTTPRRWERRDVLAAGVLITRFVAAEGGNEMENVAALRTLESKLGKTAGRGVFEDLVWQEDPKAVTTVQGRSFSNIPGSAADRARTFTSMADFAATIPLELATGPGTGGSPEPTLPPRAPVAAPAANPLGVPQAAVARAVTAVHEYLTNLRGGSIAAAVAPKNTRDGKALLLSGPQLGYSYPSMLWELEVHGGGYDARGAAVPGLPTIGIGYGKRVAWALTSGYSKSIDSYIETTRPGASAGDPPQYLHDGKWKDADCRTETVRYRAAPEGVPVGPALLSQDVRACRTVHGPIVATTADGTKSRSVQYAMWGRELETIKGTLAWNSADTFAEFEAGVRAVTWNENVLYADADGRIAYWHPGLELRRKRSVDMRLPAPGTGEHDPDGLLTFEEMPHSVDPPEGYLVNWNNKPARGWLDGEGRAPFSRPAGPVQRVTLLHDLLRGRKDLDLKALMAVDRLAGSRDVRLTLYRPLLAELARRDDLTSDERTAIDLLLAWDGSHYGPGADTMGEPATDGPAPTLYDAFVLAVRRELFAGLLPDDGSDAILDRQTGVGSHVYDAPPLDNLATRILRPGFSGLVPSRDYTGGRAPQAVVAAALRSAIASVREISGPDLTDARRPHPRSEVCSLTDGVIGPCLTMPYEDRGGWVHVIALAAPVRAAPVPPVRTPRPMPATGAVAPHLGLLVVLAGAALRRRARHV
ncbi:MAG TPA: penicillin acylase family protein [Mycobacteriales bacterium]|nr:penicillin acylase family protein [Mycobacteriales bacterium]